MSALSRAMGSACACSPSTFTNLNLFGSEILSVSASVVSNYTKTAPDEETVHHPTIDVRGAKFCNVTVTYTHPGQHDEINVEVWLPIGNWNERLMAAGGGNYAAGRFSYTEYTMAAAIGQGYATVTTDAGLGPGSSPEPWALLSPGNVNLYALRNLGSVSLNDEAVIAKSAIKDYYQKPPKFSYWSGCSQGGRQGYMLAQRYPDVYDGIAASSPAFNWGEMVPGIHWPQVVMKELGEYPAPCELARLAEAAVETCDGQDGVLDGVISDMDGCRFDPFTHVGEMIACPETGKLVKLSRAAAVVANATWSGPRRVDGSFLWYGLGYGADFQGVAATNCTAGACVPEPQVIGTSWLRLFLAKDTDFDVAAVTQSEYDRLVHQSVQEYNSIIGTRDPDLSAFHAAGGKLLTFHGMSDPLIPYRGTDDYYDAVAAKMPEIDDFYRYFHIPGYGHCAGGNGAAPTTSFRQLREWVEEGKKPDTVPVEFEDAQGHKYKRPLCPYPGQGALRGGRSDSSQELLVQVLNSR